MALGRMAIPHVKPFAGTLPRKAFDENDPRALDLFPAHSGEKLPAFGLLGIPFDGAVLGRKGCGQWPAGIREAFRFDSSYNFEDDVQLFGQSAADLGDVGVAGDNVEKTHDAVTETLSHLFSNGCHPLIMGGDNS